MRLQPQENHGPKLLLEHDELEIMEKEFIRNDH